MQLFQLKSTKLDITIRCVMCHIDEILPLINHFAQETQDLIVATQLADIAYSKGNYDVLTDIEKLDFYSNDFRVFEDE